MKSLRDRWPKLFGHNLQDVTGNLWGMNEGGGRFYAASRPHISTQQKLDLLAAAGITYVEAHDTDILDLARPGVNRYPDGTETEKMILLERAVEKFETELKSRGMYAGMYTMNLFNSDVLFNRGNISSECDATRNLAFERTKIGLAIAQRLGCLYVYWNGTDGVDGPFGANHAKRNGIAYDSLVRTLSWHRDTHGAAAVPFAAEAKVEEPKWKMYHGTSSSFLALYWRLMAQHPDLAELFGLNIETAHSEMAKTNAAMDFGEALESGALLHVHENGQYDIAFDRDIAPDHIGLFDRMYQLLTSGYPGLVGIDVQPIPTDRADQAAATIIRTAKRIKWAVEKARTVDHKTVAALMAEHDQAGLEALLDTHLFDIK